MSPCACEVRSRFGGVAIRAVGLAIVACLTMAGPGMARQAGPAEPSELQRRLHAVPLVELRLFTGETVRGRPVGWVEDWLLLDTGRRVAAGEVSAAESLRRRTGKDGSRGVLLGVIAGAGMMMVADRGEGEARDWVPRTIAAAAGGALVGGVTGALIGARRYDRDTVYTASTLADRRESGLVEYRLGPAPARIRTRLAVTPYAAIGRYGFRTGRTGEVGVQYGIAPSQELGVQLQYALGPRFVARAGAGALRTSPKYRWMGLNSILVHDMLLGRGELALEFRMRPDVPGYFVLAADGIYNPEGYALGGEIPSDQGGSAQVRPGGLDSGVLPRVGLGLGFDIFASNDRRLRIEWLYRVGRYHAPAVAERSLETTRVVRDTSFSIGFHIPIVRPAAARRPTSGRL